MKLSKPRLRLVVTASAAVLVVGGATAGASTLNRVLGSHRPAALLTPTTTIEAPSSTTSTTTSLVDPSGTAPSPTTEPEIEHGTDAGSSTTSTSIAARQHDHAAAEVENEGVENDGTEVEGVEHDGGGHHGGSATSSTVPPVASAASIVENGDHAGGDGGSSGGGSGSGHGSGHGSDG